MNNKNSAFFLEFNTTITRFQEKCVSLNRTRNKKETDMEIKDSATRRRDVESGKSEYQIHLEWIRGLLINMQENGVGDKYGDQVEDNLCGEIKWLTDRIDMAKREDRFREATMHDSDGMSEKERKVATLITQIAECICYPNDHCLPDIYTVTKEFENIFNEKKECLPKMKQDRIDECTRQYEHTEA